jgi:hypothetical protein
MVEKKEGGEKRNGTKRGRSDATVSEFPAWRVTYTFIFA